MLWQEPNTVKNAQCTELRVAERYNPLQRVVLRCNVLHCAAITA
jgi:hypothetical protein